MAAPSEVKVNIRHNVLLLETFTVPQLQAITGLNRQSIHTEVRRMEKEGIVSRVGFESREKGSVGGRPPVVYQLTSDAERRFEVLQSVRAFYLDREEPISELPRPESKHYFIARDLLHDSKAKRTSLAPNEKAERLAVIEKRLEYARQEEEVGEEGTQLIAASFDILQAKARDILADDWEQAIKLLDEARGVCQALGADDLVEDIQEYVQNMVRLMVDQQMYCDEAGLYEMVENIASNLGIIKHRFLDVPEITTCIRQAQRLAAKVREQQIMMQAEQRTERHFQLLAAALRQRQTIVITQVVREIEEPRTIPVIDILPFLLGHLPSSTEHLPTAIDHLAANDPIAMLQLLQAAAEQPQNTELRQKLADVRSGLLQGFRDSQG
jgi:predicted ArsR family transcriptional regulator